MELDNRGLLNKLVLESIDRFIIELLIVILGCGVVLEFGWNILKGKF